jgi:hypothetical protein
VNIWGLTPQSRMTRRGRGARQPATTTTGSPKSRGNAGCPALRGTTRWPLSRGSRPRTWGQQGGASNRGLNSAPRLWGTAPSCSVWGLERALGLTGVRTAGLTLPGTYVCGVDYPSRDSARCCKRLLELRRFGGEALTRSVGSAVARLKHL